MWRMTTRLATATLSATLALVAAADARGAAVQSFPYSTFGTVGAPEVTLASAGSGGSVGPIGFEGVSSGTMTTPGAFNLGSFTVATLPPSASLTYDDTPYSIFLTGFGTASTYRVDGVLDGTLDGAGSSSMVARVTSITSIGAPVAGVEPPFALADLRVVAPQAIAAPANYLGSRTAFLGHVATNISPIPAPEPASIAIVAAGLAAWGLKRRRRPAA